jgi:hypothetical protein
MRYAPSAAATIAARMYSMAGLLEAVATAHVRPSNQEKQNGDNHEKQIEHILISP